MTLILSLMNREQAVLVSDRRLTRTRDGQPVDEESNKAAGLICRDARVAIAFTGLARDERDFRTNRWLWEALSDWAGPDFLIQPIIARFRDRAKRDLAKVRVAKPADKRLSVALAGYVYEEAGPRYYIWLVSNFETWNMRPRPEPDDVFEVSSRREKRPAEDECDALFIAGTDTVADDAVDSMRTMLKEGKPAHALVGKAVAVLRATAASSKAGGRIGKQCTSIVLPSDPSKDAQVEYHTMTATRKIYGVSLIDARGPGGYVIRDPEFEHRDTTGAPTILAVPRNAPCPCGSRKKYKRCHGRAS